VHRAGTIFRFRRNPPYLTLGLIYSGVALFANSLWALILLITDILIMQRFVIRPEKDHLARLRRAIRALHEERPARALIGPPTPTAQTLKRSAASCRGAPSVSWSRSEPQAPISSQPPPANPTQRSHSSRLRDLPWLGV
jgi:Phospholipid methyltransferase